MSEKCFYCDAPAVRFCDFNIGGPIGGYARIGPVSDNKFYGFFDIDSLPFTCDMPMCLDHSKKVGNVFMTGANETIDYCPEHVTTDELKICCPCTEEEASVIRRSIRATARRSMFSLSGAKP